MPFYVQLWLNDPYADFSPEQKEVAKFDAPVRDRKLPYTTPQSIYAATITTIDRQLGELFDGMEVTGLDENTIIIFTSDNGPEDIEIRSAQWSAAGSAGPLRGRKSSIYESGVHVPWIMKWPGRIPAGVINDTTAINAVDVFPSLARLALAEIPAEAARHFTAQGYGGEYLSAVFSPINQSSRQSPCFGNCAKRW